ncbi:hypothetical protein LSAT2_023048 [Lamellibrachia satsuma]|nr:hypothetical protein LSAT2_023048 [Lamellibrachia satsuma]
MITLSISASYRQCLRSRPGSLTTSVVIVAILVVCSCTCQCASTDSPSCGDKAIPSNETRKGRDLWCYECRETYFKKYNVVLSPCLNNLSLITVRQCGVLDVYCKVERIDLHLNVMSIERSCSGSCPYGCKFSGYGLTYRRFLELVRISGRLTSGRACLGACAAERRQVAVHGVSLDLRTECNAIRR